MKNSTALSEVPKRAVARKVEFTPEEWALMLQFRSLSATEKYCVTGLIDNLAPVASANHPCLRLVVGGAR
ncbi:MAG: hypothetical protein JWR21_868 [Herminiimonas sp.]|nr:hypothetical protein [Herminiimonas sp.]